MFGIKKCGKQDCSICKPPHLPEDVFKEVHHLPDPTPENESHYKSFLNLYGTLTTEKHLPSLKRSGKSAHSIPFSPNAQTAREILICSDWLKPHVIYVTRSRKRGHFAQEFKIELLVLKGRVASKQ